MSSSTDSEIHNSVAERSAEIALSIIGTLKKELEDKDIRLNEAFALIDDKEKELERERLLIGELELKIEELRKKPSEQLAKLQAEYDLLKEENKELRAIEGKRSKEQDFIPASKVVSPLNVWVAAINALNLYRGLNEGSKYAIEHNDPWKKVIFDVAADGQLKNARLEEEDSSP